MRKLLGYILGLLGLVIYIILVLRLGDAILPRQVVVEMIYYTVTGIGWIFPVMGIIRWWYKVKHPDNNQRSS